MTLKDGLIEILRYDIMRVNNYTVTSALARDIACTLADELGIKNHEAHANEFWVYSKQAFGSWDMHSHDCIESALEEAASSLNDSSIVCNGKVIDWGIISDTQVAYHDPRTNRLKMYTIGSFKACLEHRCTPA